MAGFIVGDSKFTLGAPYGICLAIESATLFASFLFLQKEYLLGEWCAAFAMGIQNAMVTSFSGMAIRTTHLTGMLTDIGNILGQSCRSDSKAELWGLRIHVPIFFSFLIGGFVGFAMWVLVREYSLLVPVIFTGGVSVLYLSLPFIKEASKALKEATSLTNLAELGLVIPGMEQKEQTGPVNYKREFYQVQLEEQMRGFMADIECDNAHNIELDDFPIKTAPMDEETKLLN
jgi:hypothetical protein